MDATTRLYNASNDELTTKERFMKMLVDCGMFAEQAEQVMTVFMAEADKSVDDYRFTWSSPAREYPDAVYNMMWFNLKECAAKWTEKNMPHAWYRAVFDS